MSLTCTVTENYSTLLHLIILRLLVRHPFTIHNQRFKYLEICIFLSRVLKLLSYLKSVYTFSHTNPPAVLASAKKAPPTTTNTAAKTSL